MGCEPWSKAEVDWLRDRWPTMSAREIAESYPAGFPLRTTDAIRSRAKRLGLAKADGYDAMHGHHAWTPGADAWLRRYAPGHSTAEILREARSRLGMDLSVHAVRNRLHKLGVRQGVYPGRFGPGHPSCTKGVPIVAVPERIYPVVTRAVGGLEYHDRESLDVAMAYAEVVVARRALQTGRRDGGGR